MMDRWRKEFSREERKTSRAYDTTKGEKEKW